MKINRHTLHCLLVDYPGKKSELRKDLERIRGDVNDHKKMYDDLTSEEMLDLTQSFTRFINKNKIHPIEQSDTHFLVHRLMCQYLLAYELDFPLDHDPLRKVVEYYFLKLNTEMHLSQDNSALKTWIHHLTQFPHFYINQLFIGGMGNDYRLPDLELGECGCADVSHDRLLSDIRVDVEKQIISECLKRKPDDSNKPLRILSLGTGKGLQDFILLYKLFALNINNIAMTLIEPEYDRLLNPQKKSVTIWDKNWDESKKLPQKYLTSQQKKLYSITRALSLLTRVFPEAKLSIHQADSITRLDKNHAFDVIHAIDYEDYSYENSNAYRDFQTLGNHLKDDGTILLSYHYCIKNFVKENNQLKESFTQEYNPTEFNQKLGGYLKKRRMNETFFYDERIETGFTDEKPSRFLK